MIVQNYIDCYPLKAATYIRNITYCVILTRGSLSLGFRGVIPIVIAISIVPSIIESLVTAAMARSFFNMESNFSYTLGYMLGNVGAGVTLPSIFLLIVRGVKMREHIHQLHVMGCLLDNLINGTVFAIFRNKVESDQLDDLNPMKKSTSQIISKQVVNLCISVASGLAGGLIMFGLFLLLFIILRNISQRKYCYLGFFLSCAIAVPIISEQIGVTDAKFVTIILGTYLIQRFIKFKRDASNLPIPMLRDVWLQSQFLFYGSVGSEIKFQILSIQSIKKSIIEQNSQNHNTIFLIVLKWESFVITLIGIISRFITTFLCCYTEIRKEYRLEGREKLLLSLAWCAKAGGQGALANSSMTYLSKYGAANPELMQHLNEISATALLSIVIFQPLSAFWIANTGPFLLPPAELRRLQAIEKKQNEVKQIEAEVREEKKEKIISDQKPEFRDDTVKPTQNEKENLQISI